MASGLVCNSCGCSCKTCNSTSLDLHHDVELLTSQLNEARSTIMQLKSKLSALQRNTKDVKSQEDQEKQDTQAKYDRLMSSHHRLEAVNEGLEEKLLELVQQNDVTQEETLQIHTDLQEKLRQADKRNEQLHLEKDRLASNCALAVELLRRERSYGSLHKASSTPALDTLLHDKQIERILSDAESHEEANPIDDPASDDKPKVVTVSTFPPCAIILDSSSKRSPRSESPIPRSRPPLGIPRNYSDSRLAFRSNHPTDVTVCTACGDARWTRDSAMQTEGPSGVRTHVPTWTNIRLDQLDVV